MYKAGAIGARYAHTSLFSGCWGEKSCSYYRDAALLGHNKAAMCYITSVCINHITNPMSKECAAQFDNDMVAFSKAGCESTVIECLSMHSYSNLQQIQERLQQQDVSMVQKL